MTSTPHGRNTRSSSVARWVQTRGNDYPNITTTLLIRSDPLRKALREVMEITQGVNWNGLVLKFDPQLLLAFLPRIRVASSYNSLDSSEDEEGTTKAHLNLLIEFLESEYPSTRQKIGTLVDHGEVTFDFLWAMFVPGEILFALCETTATHGITIENFDGNRKIIDLTAYSLKHHPAAERIRQKIIARGRKWSSLHGAHHKQYNGLASRESERGRLVVRVNGRIMIDREPGYSRPTPRKGLLGLLWDAMEDDEPRRKKSNLSSVAVEDLKEDDLLMATPIVYGFSLTAKRWFEFNVECVTDIEWNDNTFDQLAIDPDRKILIRGLVKSHSGLNEERSVDDFVAGKGGGLIMNLFDLRKPLYIVSAGDLGTDPKTLDGALTKIFSLVPAWDAVVLIDEVDVFLEERGTADVERNAMVAVFLRQLEYFQGILFMTTNRVKQFDAAFQSRIHLDPPLAVLQRSFPR
ncbi:hypothetical protein DFH09DRAFT_1453903 [Mycena vulgaris]|nr:hypothetical protein DFH09DRAFT_1453903 [Mycena vulgaris]